MVHIYRLLVDIVTYAFRGDSVAVDKDIVDQASTVWKSTRAWNQVVVDVTFRYDTEIDTGQLFFATQPKPTHQMSYPNQPTVYQRRYQLEQRLFFQT